MVARRKLRREGPKAAVWGGLPVGPGVGAPRLQRCSCGVNNSAWCWRVEVGLKAEIGSCSVQRLHLPAPSLRSGNVAPPMPRNPRLEKRRVTGTHIPDAVS